MPPTDIKNDASNQPAENNPTSMNNAEQTDAENTNPVRNVITAPSDPPNRNTANSTPRTPTNVNQHKKYRRTRSQNNNISQPLQDKETVINLSTVRLSNSETKLLSRGLTFVPTPKSVNWAEIQADINDFARRLRLKEFFQQHDNNT